MNEPEQQGMLKAFEYTYELAWLTMKDYYEMQGETDIQGSRDAIRMAFNKGLISDGDTWMSMIQSRIRTAHSYDEETANEIATDIVQSYFHQFSIFRQTMEGIKNKNL